MTRAGIYSAIATLACVLSVGAAPASADFGYIGQWGTTGSGAGQFEAPVDVATDGSGNVYVVDNMLSSGQKFSATGQYLDTFGQPPGEDCTHSDDPPPVGQLCIPNGVSVNQNGVYVMSSYGGRIEKFNTAGVSQTAFGHLYCGGPTAPPKPWFCYPARVAAGTAGTVYGDDSTALIQAFDSDGDPAGSWDGPMCNLGCQHHGLAVNPNQNLYITDTFWSLVAATDGTAGGSTAGGVFTFGIWGGAGSSTSQFGDNATQPGPDGIAVAPNGNVYVADNVNNRIQVFQGVGLNTGSYITSFGSTGTGPGQFNNPRGVTVDSSGNVYVADTGNDRIQKFGEVATPIPVPATPVTPNPLPNATAPKLVALAVQNPTLRARSAKKTRHNRKLKTRTVIRYVLNESATVTLSFSRKGSNHKQVGSFTQPSGSGINRFAFSGRVAGRNLRPGRYAISAQATDASGLKTAVVRTTLRVVR